jgi:hypothetical protein
LTTRTGGATLTPPQSCPQHPERSLTSFTLLLSLLLGFAPGDRRDATPSIGDAGRDSRPLSIVAAKPAGKIEGHKKRPRPKPRR